MITEIRIVYVETSGRWAITYKISGEAKEWLLSTDWQHAIHAAVVILEKAASPNDPPWTDR